MRLAALCRCGRCGGPRRWSFSAGARAGPPVARSARHASMLLALPDRGSPWEPSRDCLPDEIAEERVADGVRVGGSVAEFTVTAERQGVSFSYFRKISVEIQSEILGSFFHFG